VGGAIYAAARYSQPSGRDPVAVVRLHLQRGHEGVEIGIHRASKFDVPASECPLGREHRQERVTVLSPRVLRPPGCAASADLPSPFQAGDQTCHLAGRPRRPATEFRKLVQGRSMNSFAVKASRRNSDHTRDPWMVLDKGNQAGEDFLALPTLR
jgi:hypothetical protein